MRLTAPGSNTSGAGTDVAASLPAAGASWALATGAPVTLATKASTTANATATMRARCRTKGPCEMG